MIPDNNRMGHSRKDPYSPHGGEKKLFLMIVNVLGHPKGIGGLTSYFLRGGGMDVFWNDPMYHLFYPCPIALVLVFCAQQI